MKKIYIGCSLTHSPQEFRDMISALKDKLRSDYEILDFVGLKNGTPTEVYKFDIQCVIKCDLFVAICDYPAIGLGYEFATALEKYSKPTLALANENAKISRLVLGIDHPMYTFRRYSKTEEIISAIKEKESKHYEQTFPIETCESDTCIV